MSEAIHKVYPSSIVLLGTQRNKYISYVNVICAHVNAEREEKRRKHLLRHSILWRNIGMTRLRQSRHQNRACRHYLIHSGVRSNIEEAITLRYNELETSRSSSSKCQSTNKYLFNHISTLQIIHIVMCNIYRINDKSSVPARERKRRIKRHI